MCFYTEKANEKPKIAKKAIVCYKLFARPSVASQRLSKFNDCRPYSRKLVYSKYRLFGYEKGQTYFENSMEKPRIV